MLETVLSFFIGILLATLYLLLFKKEQAQIMKKLACDPSQGPKISSLFGGLAQRLFTISLLWLTVHYTIGLIPLVTIAGFFVGFFIGIIHLVRSGNPK